MGTNWNPQPKNQSQIHNLSKFPAIHGRKLAQFDGKTSPNGTAVCDRCSHCHPQILFKHIHCLSYAQITANNRLSWWQTFWNYTLTNKSKFWHYRVIINSDGIIQPWGKTIIWYNTAQNITILYGPKCSTIFNNCMLHLTLYTSKPMINRREINVAFSLTPSHTFERRRR